MNTLSQSGQYQYNSISLVIWCGAMFLEDCEHIPRLDVLPSYPAVYKPELSSLRHHPANSCALRRFICFFLFIF